MSAGGLSDGELREIARVFHESRSASQLLDAAGFPRGRVPAWHTYTADEFWWHVNGELDSGVLEDGRRRILDAARQRFPANVVFAAAGDHGETPPVPGPAMGLAEPWDSGGSGDPGGTPGGGSGKGVPPWRRGPLESPRIRLVVAVATVVVLLAGALSAMVVLRGDGGDLRAEPVGKAVIDAFMPSMGRDVPAAPVSSPRGPVGGVIPAESAGLYGGTRNNGTCDRAKMASYLRAHAPLLAAWTGVLKVKPDDLENYLNALTPVVLRTDTLITNHGFKAGRVTEFQAVLQAGTAVLVDGHGTPVVKCGCGNPLTRPALTPATAKKANVVGETWRGFTTKSVTQVESFTVPAQVFVLSDLGSGTLFTRDRGTAGERDHDFVPAANIDWRNTKYRIDCAAGTAFDVHDGIGVAVVDGRTYDLVVVNVARGDLLGGSSAEVSVLVTCGPRGVPPPRQLLYVYRDGPNVVDSPRPPSAAGQAAPRFADDQLTIKDGLLVTGAYYPHGTGSGGEQLQTVRFVWNGQRFVPTTATSSPRPGVSPPAGARLDLSGTWRGTLHITEPITADVPFKLELHQDGTSLTGTISSSETACGLSGSPVGGTLTNDTVAFTVTNDPNETRFQGKVSGDSISGSGTSRCYGGQGTWSVRRGA
jgi:hypothetical protein